MLFKLSLPIVSNAQTIVSLALNMVDATEFMQDTTVLCSLTLGLLMTTSLVSTERATLK